MTDIVTDDTVEQVARAIGTIANLPRARLIAAAEAAIIAMNPHEIHNNALRMAASICTPNEERPAKISEYKLQQMSVEEQFSYRVTQLAWKDADEILSHLRGGILSLSA